MTVNGINSGIKFACEVKKGFIAPDGTLERWCKAGDPIILEFLLAKENIIVKSFFNVIDQSNILWHPAVKGSFDGRGACVTQNVLLFLKSDPVKINSLCRPRPGCRSDG